MKLSECPLMEQLKHYNFRGIGKGAWRENQI